MNPVRLALAAWRRLRFPPWVHVEILLQERRERRHLRRALRRAAWVLDRLEPPPRLELIVQRSVPFDDRPSFGEWRVRSSAEGRLVILRLAAEVAGDVVPPDELVALFTDTVIDLAEIYGQQSEMRVPLRGPGLSGQSPLGAPARVARTS